jgi:hypothetical protein
MSDLTSDHLGEFQNGGHFCFTFVTMTNYQTPRFSFNILSSCKNSLDFSLDGNKRFLAFHRLF